MVRRVLLGLAASSTIVLGLSAATSAPAGVVPPHPATAATVPAPRPALLLPDMRPLASSDLQLELTRSGERVVRFTSGLANIGRGPLEVRPNRAQRCPPRQQHATQVVYRDVDGNHHFKRSVDTGSSRFSAGCMIFHPAHDHWHFEAAARYSLFRPSDHTSILVRARKMSFCLRDSERVPNALGVFHQPLYYEACGRRLPQGISPGWVDIYSYYLVGQAITLPHRLPNGVYCIGVRVDPRDVLRESDEADNNSVRGFRLHGNLLGPVHHQPCLR